MEIVLLLKKKCLGPEVASDWEPYIGFIQTFQALTVSILAMSL